MGRSAEGSQRAQLEWLIDQLRSGRSFFIWTYSSSFPCLVRHQNCSQKLLDRAADQNRRLLTSEPAWCLVIIGEREWRRSCDPLEIRPVPKILKKVLDGPFGQLENSNSYSEELRFAAPVELTPARFSSGEARLSYLSRPHLPVSVSERIHEKANLSKEGGAMLWAFSAPLMVAKLPKESHMDLSPLQVAASSIEPAPPPSGPIGPVQMPSAGQATQDHKPQPEQTERKVCRDFVKDKLRDEILLKIRGGDWHLSHPLAEVIEAHLPDDLAVSRFLLSGGSKDELVARQKAQGKYLFLKDTIALLKRKGLIEVRTRADGYEEIRSTPCPADFVLDSELENLLPRLPEEVATLEEMLLKSDRCEPLTLWRPEETKPPILVDGYVRVALYSLVGRKYEVTERTFQDRSAVIAFRLNQHAARYTGSPEMKWYVRGKHYNSVKQSHGGKRELRKKQASVQKTHLQDSTGKTAKDLGKQYGVDPLTLRRDGKYASALDHLAELCGDKLRLDVLTRKLKWNRAEIEGLGGMERGEMKRIAEEALKDGARPELPERGGRKSVAVNLPLDKPNAQAAVLEERLGADGLERLCRAGRRRLKKRQSIRQAHENTPASEDGEKVSSNGVDQERKQAAVSAQCNGEEARQAGQE